MILVDVIDDSVLIYRYISFSNVPSLCLTLLFGSAGAVTVIKGLHEQRLQCATHGCFLR
jgi:hypothetical protein